MYKLYTIQPGDSIALSYDTPSGAYIFVTIMSDDHSKLRSEPSKVSLTAVPRPTSELIETPQPRLPQTLLQSQSPSPLELCPLLPLQPV